METIPTRIAIYARVSTEGARSPDGSRLKGQTVDPQLLELREWTARNGIPAGEWTDVMSGTKAARPGLDSLLAACKAGGIDCIAVVKLDRLGRSLLNVVKLVEELSEAGIGVVCTTQGIDTRKDSACGKFITQIFAAFAQLERAFISERTVAGLAAVKARGVILGHPSDALRSVQDIPAVVAQWRLETGGKGLRELAKRLGGCSPTTAGKLAKL